LYSGRIVLRRKLMRLARLAVVIAAVVAMGSVSLTAQKPPDLENGFKTTVPMTAAIWTPST